MDQQPNPGPQPPAPEGNVPEEAARAFSRTAADQITTGHYEPPDEATAALDELGRKREEQAAADQADREHQMNAALSPEALNEEHGHIGPKPATAPGQQPPAGPEQQHGQQAA